MQPGSTPRVWAIVRTTASQPVGGEVRRKNGRSRSSAATTPGAGGNQASSTSAIALRSEGAAAAILILVRTGGSAIIALPHNLEILPTAQGVNGLVI